MFSDKALQIYILFLLCMVIVINYIHQQLHRAFVGVHLSRYKLTCGSFMALKCHHLSTYRGARKSLAWPGRKQATVTKLLQATQKQFRKLSVPLGHHGGSDLRVGWKMATFQLFFYSGRAKDLSAPLYSTSTFVFLFHHDRNLNILSLHKPCTCICSHSWWAILDYSLLWKGQLYNFASVAAVAPAVQWLV